MSFAYKSNNKSSTVKNPFFAKSVNRSPENALHPTDSHFDNTSQTLDSRYCCNTIKRCNSSKGYKIQSILLGLMLVSSLANGRSLDAALNDMREPLPPAPPLCDTCIIEVEIHNSGAVQSVPYDQYGGRQYNLPIYKTERVPEVKATGMK